MISVLSRILVAVSVSAVLPATPHSRQPAAPAPSPTATSATATPSATDYDWSGLAEDEVVIVRDDYGVPHVYGHTLPALTYGDGYAQAQDQLIPLLDRYVQATGMRAYTYGATRENILSDIFVRTLRIDAVGRERFGELPENIQEALETFAAGVNAYIADYPQANDLPLRRVEATDVLAWMRFQLLIRQTTGAKGDLKQSFPQAQFPLPVEGLEAADAEASNGWALAPERTADGSTILGGDPHIAYGSYPQKWEKHLVTPTHSVYGVAPLGVPGVTAGTNENFAWAMTAAGEDRGDAFLLRPCDKGHGYILDDVCTPFEEIPEKVPVASGLPLPFTVRLSAFGPVLPIEVEGYMVALGLSGFDAIGQPVQIYEMDRAQNLDEFLAALALQQSDGTQVSYADRDGNIAYTVSARPMVRNEAYDWTRAVPGDTSDTLYKGVLPFDELPLAINPDTDYVQASNTPDWLTTGGAWGLHPDQFPSYVWNGKAGEAELYDNLPERPSRLVELITASDGHTLDTATSVSFDSYVLLADWLIPLLHEAADTYASQYPRPEVFSTVLEILDEWDRYASEDATAYMLFADIVRWLPPHFELQDMAREPGYPETVPEEMQQAAADAIWEAAAETYGIFGTLEVPTIDVKEIQRGPTAFPIGAGDSITQTLFQASPDSFDTATRKAPVDKGSSFIHVTQLPPRTCPEGDPCRVRTRSVRPYGQSEHEGSPFFADQTAMFVARQVKDVPFYPDEVEARATDTRVLTMP